MNNFWSSFPGILTAIAAIITSIAGTSELIKVLKPEESPTTKRPNTEVIQKTENKSSNKAQNKEKHKYAIEKAITKYLEALEEADKKNNISILQTGMSGNILNRQIKRINRNVNDRRYLISTHRNTEIINYEVSPDESEAEAKITTVYESIYYTYQNKCISYIPETDIVLTMDLKNRSNGWIVIESSTNKTNLSNQSKRCN